MASWVMKATRWWLLKIWKSWWSCIAENNRSASLTTKLELEMLSIIFSARDNCLPLKHINASSTSAAIARDSRRKRKIKRRKREAICENINPKASRLRKLPTGTAHVSISITIDCFSSYMSITIGINSARLEYSGNKKSAQRATRAKGNLMQKKRKEILENQSLERLVWSRPGPFDGQLLANIPEGGFCMLQ